MADKKNNRRRPPLKAVPLDWAHCQYLAETITKEDAHECMAMGQTPLQALAAGALIGYSRAVIRKATGNPVGAYGFSSGSGTIWSLWAPLGLEEQKQVLRATPSLVREMQEKHGPTPLHNYVAVQNARVVKWLEAAGCFRFGPTSPLGFRHFEVSL